MLRDLYPPLPNPHLLSSSGAAATAMTVSFWYGPGGQVKCRVADKAKETYKQRIRQLTRRSGGA
jgi:hypothetical protein